MRSGMSRRVAAACAAGLVTAAAAGCGTADGGDGGPQGSDASVSVVTGVYPLQWLAERVGGEHVDVTNLTEPGAEPHDLELSPRQVGAVAEADVVLHISGLQPAVDEAVAQQAPDTGLDAADLVELRAAEEGEGHEHGDEDGHEEHGEHEEHEEHDHDHGGTDPHVWLDPERMAAIADGLAERLAEADAADADAFRANAERVSAELDDLDSAYRDGLAQCASRDLVTSHTAFGYLADRYDLTQVGISGVDPDSEPSPARMAEVARLVEEHDVTTIFTETLASPAIAETIAEETGATTAVLDPLEGITDRSPGDDYPSVMTANLEALRMALSCD
ncbi:metal ABC transporter solute-binding protein, Zn/Mn family [Marinitenerispora sediminis]|uniref:Zinc ABC transporter substrate-binding protein n=1 Tax=Marinitenerispora sediminis TaxID=1931232 RepID=A0A368T7N4_9ACTN|nr:zinc ABC transporter substrate-binding protein [Marinitenerispora sediminis]RCV52008.1 zinc ABC transporter substrate-binding protein [Marinitenerispora sediminis]RCV56919.1 zinc ABC transporter substrate-binding protein [Marinitenerispora sediminis]RCV60063.1 zinc ABC transporter substrate-binding protein [Marinitenerispora sediminis]